MKSFTLNLALVVVLSGCTGAPTDSLSDKEACQEAMRLMGKGTDVFMKAVSDPEGASANLTALAFEFGRLIEKTTDKSLKTILVQMQSGLKTMSNEATFFEGNSIYSNQITPLTQKCYGR